MDLDEEVAELDKAIDAAQLAVARQQADLEALVARRASLRRSLAELQRQRTSGSERPGDAGGELRPIRFSGVTTPFAWEDLDLAGRQRTDTIVSVLESSPKPMRIPEVVEALKITTNESHDYQVVASTLAFLCRENRIAKISRGLYGPANSDAKIGAS